MSCASDCTETGLPLSPYIHILLATPKIRQTQPTTDEILLCSFSPVHLAQLVSTRKMIYGIMLYGNKKNHPLQNEKYMKDK